MYFGALRILIGILALCLVTPRGGEKEVFNEQARICLQVLPTLQGKHQRFRNTAHIGSQGKPL